MTARKQRRHPGWVVWTVDEATGTQAEIIGAVYAPMLIDAMRAIQRVIKPGINVWVGMP